VAVEDFIGFVDPARSVPIVVERALDVLVISVASRSAVPAVVFKDFSDHR
jgi:hypothetical protein